MSTLELDGVAGAARPGLHLESALGIGIGHWRADAAEEVCTPAFTSRVVCVHLRPTEMTTWANGRGAFSGRLSAGAWMMHAPGETFRCVAPSGYEILRLDIADRAIAKSLAGLGLDPAPDRIELREPGLAANGFLLALADEAKTAMADASRASRLQVDGIVDAILAHLLLRHSNLPADSAAGGGVRGGLAAWQERRATDYLHAHFAESIPLEQLAQTANLSTFHFARAFKRSTGVAPHAYLRRLRADKAKVLLTSTTLNIGEIAAAVGYETPQAFARMFRAEVGESPNRYRRERRL